MKPGESSELKWVGVDLHVHTPASFDYRGDKHENEYIRILEASTGKADSKDQHPSQSSSDNLPIGCVAFTDHNSVEGYLAYSSYQQKVHMLYDSIRSLDAKNPLLSRLENERRTFSTLRVLMGCELNLDPGIHILCVFQENLDAGVVKAYLESIYDQPYSVISGDPTPITAVTLQAALDLGQKCFAEKALFIGAHVDSSSGLVEGLKEHGRLRVAALTHPYLKALSFNKIETRTHLVKLFEQPDYHRREPLAFLQASDFHGAEGSMIGQMRTELKVAFGKATFSNIAEALRYPARVRCSIDSLEHDYSRTVEGQFVAKVTSNTGQLTFTDSDLESVARNACAMLNSDGGIIQLEGVVDPSEVPESYRETFRGQFERMLQERLAPTSFSYRLQDFRLSATKVRLLVRLGRSNRIHTANSAFYTLRGPNVALATASDIEAITSRNFARRFGGRIERSLNSIAQDSTLLAKTPQGMALLLSCQDKLAYGLARVAEVERGEQAPEEARELIAELERVSQAKHPFGHFGGNTTLVGKPVAPRHMEHYERITSVQIDADADLLSRAGVPRVEARSIIVIMGGSVHLLEPGFIVSEVPYLRLAPIGKWTAYIDSLAGWLKSSFFLWHGAVYLGNADVFWQCQLQGRKLLFPRLSDAPLLQNLAAGVQNLLVDEKKFLEENARKAARGELDAREKERLRVRHNGNADRTCLAMDKQIYEHLQLCAEDTEAIAECMKDLHLTDFGFLAELAQAKKLGH